MKKYTISAFSSKATQLTCWIRKDAEYEQKITQVQGRSYLYANTQLRT